MGSTRLLFWLALGAVQSGAAVATTTWTLTGAPTAGVSVAGYANTGNAPSYTATQNHANNGAIQTIQSAAVSSYDGGIGIANADRCTSGLKCDLNEGRQPEHAIDNQQRYDMALLTFTSPVQLTAMKLGWKYNDSDMSVLAYTAPGAPNTASGANPTFVGLKYSELVNKGWTAIGHYSNVGLATPTAINALGIVSSYWLIGAYNPLALNPLANPAGPTSFSASSYDFVKLSAVMGFHPIPEPGSLMLVASAVLGLILLRTRKMVALRPLAAAYSRTTT
jgi:hypothetical protein